MSETKNVVIKQNNGTDYDKLHPETVDSKVNLTDDNVSAWGNTLKEALPKINSRLNVVEDNQWEIGDIRITTKSDLGEKWLKADGNVYDINKYPDLAKITTVQDFPFGSQSITTGTIEGTALSFGAINETNLNSNENMERANYVNGYYFRFKDYLNISSNAYSLLVYYTQDKKNWTTVRISITLTGFTERETSGYIKGIGYVNRYWYLSFVFNTKSGFLYSTELDFSNYSVVWIQDILSKLPVFSDDSFVQWGLGIYYYNNFYSLVVGSGYSSVKHVSVIYANDINFISGLNSNRIYNGGYESGVHWGDTMITCMFNNNLYTFFTKYFTSGSGRTTYYGGLYVSNPNGSNPTGIIKIDESSGTGLQQVSFIYKGKDEMYLSVAGSSGGQSIKFTTLDKTGEEVTFPNRVPTLVLKNGKFLKGILTSGSNTWLVADNFQLENAKTYTATITGTINSSDTAYINMELPNGLASYTNSSADSSRTYTLEQGGILPNSNISSSSLTGLNTFIKALN